MELFVVGSLNIKFCQDSTTERGEEAADFELSVNIGYVDTYLQWRVCGRTYVSNCLGKYLIICTSNEALLSSKRSTNISIRICRY